MANKEWSCPGGPIHFAVFFCTDQGFGIQMVQALDEPHAVDIVQALQPGALAEAVPASRWKARTGTGSCGIGWTPLSSPWPVGEGQRSQTRWPSALQLWAQSTITRAADPQISC
jgi:hypothetical protein